MSGSNIAYAQHVTSIAQIWSGSHSALDQMLLDIVRLVDVGLHLMWFWRWLDMSRTAQMRVNLI